MVRVARPPNARDDGRPLRGVRLVPRPRRHPRLPPHARPDVAQAPRRIAQDHRGRLGTRRQTGPNAGAGRGRCRARHRPRGVPGLARRDQRGGPRAPRALRHLPSRARRKRRPSSRPRARDRRRSVAWRHRRAARAPQARGRSSTTRKSAASARIGEVLGVTESRVCQLHSEAMHLIRAMLDGKPQRKPKRRSDTPRLGDRA